MNEFNYYPIWRSEKYYFFPDDLRRFPDAWCYIVWSRRGPGKTYSALRSAYENHVNIAYMKRTIDDVGYICTRSDDFDLSPYVPINRDAHTNIQMKLIKKGIGGVYDQADEEGNPIGRPVSYVLALNAMKTIKGMDLSIVDWMLLDEFIPQAGEIVKQSEGEMLLDLYMTIARDREQRGREHLKLILFANAENISTPVTSELNIVDDMVNLIRSGDTHLYIKERGILLHHITTDEIPIDENVQRGGIYAGMQDTNWFNKAFGGEFAHNDFSQIRKSSMKNFQPVAAFSYKNKMWYIWRNGAKLYVNQIKGNHTEIYDLNTDSGKYSFYADHVVELKVETIADNVSYTSYMIYDLIMDYRKIMRLKI